MAKPVANVADMTLMHRVLGPCSSVDGGAVNAGEEPVNDKVSEGVLGIVRGRCCSKWEEKEGAVGAVVAALAWAPEKSPKTLLQWNVAKH